MTKWSPAENQRILGKYGYSGPVGSGQAEAYLSANPQYINSYAADRRQVDPNYMLSPLLMNALNQAQYQGGVAPVGQVEPFNAVQKSALSTYANADATPYQNSANNYFGSIAGLFGQANPMIQGATSALSGGAISQYMNPYNEQVIQNTVGDINRAGDIERNRINANKPGQRSFGDSSSAIQNSELSRNILDRIGSTTGALRSQGYDTAVSNINTDKNRQLAGATTLQQLIGLGGDLGAQQRGFAEDVTRNKLAAGTTIQNQNQKLLDVLRPEIGNRTNYDMTQLNSLLALLNQFPGGASGSTTSTSQNPLGQLGGAGMLGFGLLGGQMGGGQSTPWLNPDTNRFV